MQGDLRDVVVVGSATNNRTQCATIGQHTLPTCGWGTFLSLSSGAGYSFFGYPQYLEVDFRSWRVAENGICGSSQQDKRRGRQRNDVVKREGGAVPLPNETATNAQFIGVITPVFGLVSISCIH